MKQATQPVPEAAIEPDAFAGQGGSYVLEPATGLRRLVHRTAEATPATEATPIPPAGATATDTTQE